MTIIDKLIEKLEGHLKVVKLTNSIERFGYNWIIQVENVLITDGDVSDARIYRRPRD